MTIATPVGDLLERVFPSFNQHSSVCQTFASEDAADTRSVELPKETVEAPLGHPDFGRKSGDRGGPREILAQDLSSSFDGVLFRTGRGERSIRHQSDHGRLEREDLKSYSLKGNEPKRTVKPAVKKATQQLSETRGNTYVERMRDMRRLNQNVDLVRDPIPEHSP
jgi:hypothetical protein